MGAQWGGGFQQECSLHPHKRPQCGHTDHAAAAGAPCCCHVCPPAPSWCPPRRTLSSSLLSLSSTAPHTALCTKRRRYCPRPMSSSQSHTSATCSSVRSKAGARAAQGPGCVLPAQLARADAGCQTWARAGQALAVQSAGSRHIWRDSRASRPSRPEQGLKEGM